MSRPHVVVVGPGRAGEAPARLAVDAGFEIVRFDPWAGRVDGLPLPGTRAPGRAGARQDHRPSAPACCAGFDVALVAVPTELDDQGPRASLLEAALATLAAHLRPGALVVLESLARPGTTEQIVVPTCELVSGLRAGVDFTVGHSAAPRAGSERIVSGIDAASRTRVAQFYRSLRYDPVPVSSPRVSELISLLAGRLDAVDVGLVDRLAVLAAETGTPVRVPVALGSRSGVVELVHPEDPPPVALLRGPVCWTGGVRGHGVGAIGRAGT